MYVPNLKAKLLSVSKLIAKGYVVVFDVSGCKVLDDVNCTLQGEEKATASNIGGIYHLDQGSQTRSPRVHFMRPSHWSCSDFRMWPTSVLSNLCYFFLVRFFCHGPKRLKKVCYPSYRLSIAVILLSGNTKDSVSWPAALWMVIAAKELGIFQGVPPGGQYTEVVLKRSLFNDSISTKKLLYRSEKQC
jgi:hypothetical protein